VGTKRNWCTFFGANLFVLTLYGLMVLLICGSTLLAMLLAAGGVGSDLTDIGGIPLALILAIAEALMIGAPVVVFIAAGRPGKSLLKINKPRVSEMLLSFGMAVGGFGVFTFLGILMRMLLTSHNIPQDGFGISFSNGWELAVWIASLGVIPAFMEEFAFRGVVLGVYERHMRPFWAILLSAVLFGVLHLRVAFFYFYIGIGVILGWTVYRSRSIWPGILIHFTHNTLVVVLGYLQGVFPYLFNTRLGLSALMSGAYHSALGAWALFAAASLCIFFACAYAFAHMTKGRTPPVERHVPRPFVDWTPLVVILAGLAILLCLTLFSALLLPAILENIPY
jgi:membrane protease YdiL (CAAX protease family)